MNILILHNAYQQRGGEDAVVAAESTLLRTAGHDVHVEIVSNEEIAGFGDRIRTLVDAPYSRARAVWVKELCARVRPDLVHVHNFFPLLTPAVHEAASSLGLPVVQTLHNYRLICASPYLLRDGRICEKCLSGSRYWGVVHRCYRHSLPGSFAVVSMQQRAFRHGTWTQHVDRFISLSSFARAKFIEAGLPADRIVEKPNFVEDIPAAPSIRGGALFVGRLSVEKGVETLMRAWQNVPDIPLTVAGDGPERARMEALAPGNVNFVGAQSPGDIAELMSRVSALVVPSTWYEPFGLVAIEAFRAGTPVIASNIGALTEIVTPGTNGAHFRSGDHTELARTVRETFKAPDRLARLGAGARTSYEKHYTPEKNLDQLESVYKAAIASARQRTA